MRGELEKEEKKREKGMKERELLKISWEEDGKLSVGVSVHKFRMERNAVKGDRRGEE